jgi:hypothetical protein
MRRRPQPLPVLGPSREEEARMPCLEGLRQDLLHLVSGE